MLPRCSLWGHGSWQEGGGAAAAARCAAGQRARCRVRGRETNHDRAVQTGRRPDRAWCERSNQPSGLTAQWADQLAQKRIESEIEQFKLKELWRIDYRDTMTHTHEVHTVLIARSARRGPTATHTLWRTAVFPGRVHRGRSSFSQPSFMRSRQRTAHTTVTSEIRRAVRRRLSVHACPGDGALALCRATQCTYARIHMTLSPQL